MNSIFEKTGFLKILFVLNKVYIHFGNENQIIIYVRISKWNLCIIKSEPNEQMYNYFCNI